MRSQLATHVGPTPMSDDELQALARVVWVRNGVALLKPDEIPDAADKRVVTRLAERLYGKRDDHVRRQ